ncbi:hypothetical protein [Allopusillimonas soli]|uniref:Uncharacterized protein n=1 Tax=Allopusillimonas soli TaxID=659016 RepID=A0A853F709_9BURK|nr:hypothetical protein [Allopusillimonas soli]NYT35757.1 hypothetical protein [Allopusillimonas soli]
MLLDPISILWLFEANHSMQGVKMLRHKTVRLAPRIRQLIASARRSFHGKEGDIDQTHGIQDSGQIRRQEPIRDA